MPSFLDPDKPADGRPAVKQEFRGAFTTIKRELEHGGYFTYPSSGAAERRTIDRHAETVQITDFAGTFDGVADDQPTLVKAVAAAQASRRRLIVNRPVRLGNPGALAVPPEVEIGFEGNGSLSWDFGAISSANIQWGGSYPSEEPLPAITVQPQSGEAASGITVAPVWKIDHAVTDPAQAVALADGSYVFTVSGGTPAGAQINCQVVKNRVVRFLGAGPGPGYNAGAYTSVPPADANGWVTASSGAVTARFKLRYGIRSLGFAGTVGTVSFAKPPQLDVGEGGATIELLGARPTISATLTTQAGRAPFAGNATFVQGTPQSTDPQLDPVLARFASVAERFARTVSIRDFGARLDARALYGAFSTVPGQTGFAFNLGFTTADVGKVIIIGGSGAGGDPLHTRIKSVTSATNWTIADPVQTAASYTATSGALAGAIIWGTDDSHAWRRAQLWLLKYSRGRVTAQGDDSNRVAAALRMPAGASLVTRPGSIIGFEADTSYFSKFRGFALFGEGDSVSEILYFPKPGTKAATKPFMMNRQHGTFVFRDVGFIGFAPKATWFYSWGRTFVNGLQGLWLDNMRVSGIWRNLVTGAGDNNNDTFMCKSVMFGASYTTSHAIQSLAGNPTDGGDQVMNEPSSDQLLGWWFYGLQFGGSSGFCKLEYGGHFRIYGMDMSGWGGGGGLGTPLTFTLFPNDPIFNDVVYMFDLRRQQTDAAGSTTAAFPARGVTHFELDGFRIEAKSVNYRRLACNWNQGNIVLRNGDESSQATDFSTTETMLIQRLNGLGASLLVQNWDLAGTIGVEYQNTAFPYQSNIVIENCLWLQRGTLDGVVTYRDIDPFSKAAHTALAGRPLVRLAGCRLAASPTQTGTGYADSSVSVPGDADFGFDTAGVAYLTPRTVSLHMANGNGPQLNFATMRARLRSGALVANFRALIPPAATIGTESGALYDLKSDKRVAIGNGTLAAGSAALNLPAAAFAAGDVGKRVIVTGAGSGGANLATTIAAVTDGQNVTLGASATTGVTAAPVLYAVPETLSTITVPTALNLGGSFTGSAFAWKAPATMPDDRSLYVEKRGGGSPSITGALFMFDVYG